MGQRSQIYVITKQDNEYNLTARYYQWNYGERMISRARSISEWLKEHREFYAYEAYRLDISRLDTIMRVNFDMRDVVDTCDIVREFAEYSDDKGSVDEFLSFVFAGQDNNDGQCYIYMDCDSPDMPLEIALFDSNFECSADDKPVSPAEYLARDIFDERNGNWKELMSASDGYDDDDIRYTEDNIKWLDGNTKTMGADKLLSILEAVAEKETAKYRTETKDNAGTTAMNEEAEMER